VQFARLRGAKVFATASGKEGVELVREMGAHAAVDGLWHHERPSPRYSQSYQ
jgi:NADPH:quinone reductase-like Zn-dependent oxidoreductase